MSSSSNYILSVGVDHVQNFSESIYDSVSWKNNIHIELKIDC